MTNTYAETGLSTASAPLFSIDRSSINEVSVSGIISVVEGSGSHQTQSLLAHGDVSYRLWSRSLLKPWQLLSHLDELTINYSWLKPEHFALMMASHSCESVHLKLLEEIEALGGISRNRLGCPATYPISHEMKVQLKERGQEPQSIYHNCSGKHFGYLLALKAQGMEEINYLERDGQHFQPLKSILSSVNSRDEDSFDVTCDGCQLPNYALTPMEMARMYLGLVCGESTQHPLTAKLGYLSEIMRQHPRIVSGSERLDFRLMSAGLTETNVPVIAKEGADGLIGIGIGACSQYKNGLGILVKLASGTDSRHTESIARELLRQLGLLKEKPASRLVGPPVRTEHLKTNFHFQLALAKAR